MSNTKPATITIKTPEDYTTIGRAHGSSIEVDGVKLPNLAEFSVHFPAGREPVTVYARMYALAPFEFSGYLNLSVKLEALDDSLELVAEKVDDFVTKYALRKRDPGTLFKSYFHSQMEELLELGLEVTFSKYENGVAVTIREGRYKPTYTGRNMQQAFLYGYVSEMARIKGQME